MPKRDSPALAQGQEDVVFVPISTAKLRILGNPIEINRDAVAYILVKARSDEAMGTAKLQIASLLRQRHLFGSERKDDFQVNDPAASMAAQQASTTTIAWLLAAIA